jgi:uroporphyrinogen decarboxylase
MTKREVVRAVLDGSRPPYVPWQMGFTQEAAERLADHYGTPAWYEDLHNHFLIFPGGGAQFEPIGRDRVRDAFGVVWDRSVDRDIGVVEGQVLPEPTLAGHIFPEPVTDRVFAEFPARLRADEADPRFRVFSIGFSLYERAWTLRGMEELMVDFYEHPDFVRDLLGAIADWNLAQVDRALNEDIDAVYFGDDWGTQTGLQMGPAIWREFIAPELARLYGRVREAGKYVIIHSCGKVDSLFDELVELGLNCFNPFQPEVMDVDRLLPAYRGRLAFHGGLSTQQTLPYGSPEEVRRATRHLLELGAAGGYIFAPAHAVEGDVPLANLLAFIDEVRRQPGAPG